MTIGSAQKGPGPMPAVVAGLLVSMILTRWLGWKTAMLAGVAAAAAVQVVIFLFSMKRGRS